MANKVGTKGQLVIEKEIRDQLGIEPGVRAHQRVVGDHVEIRFEHNRSLAGILRPLIKPEILAEVEKLEWNEIKQRAWESAVREDWELDDKANAEEDID